MTVAPAKSAIMVFARPGKPGLQRHPIVKIAGKTVPVVKETVCLGVTLYNQLYFRTHIIRQSQKARRAIDKVARLAMSEFSLNTQGRRTLYKGVFEGILLYACSVWTHRLINSTYRKHNLRAQRHELCRLFGAYSVTSLEALSLIIAEPPIH